MYAEQEPTPKQVNNWRKEDEWRRSRRATARKAFGESGSPLEKHAVKLSESGYGFEDIQAMTGVSRAIARLLVLGI